MNPTCRVLSAAWLIAVVPGPARSQEVKPSVAQARSEAFLVKPYLQWGESRAGESLRVLWHAEDVDLAWTVELREGRDKPWRQGRVLESRRIAISGVAPHRVVRASIEGIAPGSPFQYRVLIAGTVVFEAEARAPRSASQAYRFVAFGDCGVAEPDQNAVAYQAYQARPDFVMITGDIVYSRGRASEYRSKFWPIYNADVASPRTGAPLLRSTLFLAAPGNHDIAGRDLDAYPDTMAYYYYWDQPRNGPADKEGGPLVPILKGSRANKDAFASAAADAYPRMANFSLNYGNAHWTILDANPYVDWTDPDLRAWLAADLASAKDATWRFVAFHHPGFNSSLAHFTDQRMRLVADVLEAGRVDIVFSGHVHNYQRTFPLRFFTDKDAAGRPVVDKMLVPGEWTLDKKFDGKAVTRPEGVIYLITGAGGAQLYNPEQQDKPETWQGFTDKFVSKVHSLTVVDVDGGRLSVRQLDLEGREVDRFAVTK